MTGRAAVKKRPVLQLRVDFEAHAKLDGWRRDPGFQRMTDKLAKQRGTACSYCGFSDPEDVRWVHRHGRYGAAPEPKQLIPVCSMCMSYLFMGAHVTGGEDVTRLMYFPDLSPASTNRLIRMIFCLSHDEKGRFYGVVRSLYRALRQRTRWVDEQFGTRSSVLPVFAGTLMDSGVLDHAHCATLMQPLRLLPSRNTYLPKLERWSSLLKPEMQLVMEGLSS